MKLLLCVVTRCSKIISDLIAVKNLVLYVKTRLVGQNLSGPLHLPNVTSVAGGKKKSLVSRDVGRSWTMSQMLKL